MEHAQVLIPKVQLADNRAVSHDWPYQCDLDSETEARLTLGFGLTATSVHPCSRSSLHLTGITMPMTGYYCAAINAVKPLGGETTVDWLLLVILGTVRPNPTAVSSTANARLSFPDSQGTVNLGLVAQWMVNRGLVTAVSLVRPYHLVRFLLFDWSLCYDWFLWIDRDHSRLDWAGSLNWYGPPCIWLVFPPPLTGPCVTTGQYEPSRLWDRWIMRVRWTGL